MKSGMASPIEVGNSLCSPQGIGYGVLPKTVRCLALGVCLVFTGFPLRDYLSSFGVNSELSGTPSLSIRLSTSP